MNDLLVQLHRSRTESNQTRKDGRYHGILHPVGGELAVQRGNSRFSVSLRARNCARICILPNGSRPGLDLRPNFCVLDHAVITLKSTADLLYYRRAVLMPWGVLHVYLGALQITDGCALNGTADLNGRR